MTGDPPTAVRVAIRPLPHNAGLPAYATAGAAGADLTAAVAEPVLLAPGARALIPCGFQMALPEGYEAQVRPRSGLALKHGLTLPNAPGTIDADYRGEVSVILANGGDEPFEITRGMRIAQMVIAPAPQAVFTETAELEATERGGGGFGSTGVAS